MELDGCRCTTSAVGEWSICVCVAAFYISRLSVFPDLVPDVSDLACLVLSKATRNNVDMMILSTLGFWLYSEFSR